MQDAEVAMLGSVAIWIDIVSKIAAIAAVIVAVYGGYIALQTYRAGVKNAASALIHTLFKDYLLLSVNFDENAVSAAIRRDETDEPPAEKVAGIKLYVLEEMFYWTEREEKTLDKFKYFMSKAERRERQSTIEAWRSTIRYHARDSRKYVRDNLFDYTTCYGTKFLRFIANDWNEPALSQLVAVQEQADLNSSPRPQGRREGNRFDGPQRRAPL
jgi:hypothetical protein